ncbi:MAG TPA: hypothetical protein PK597_07145, partial [Oscillospiraceae bacterium]|nr:hypothetical protein [Oscillospiraceae bacterium]
DPDGARRLADSLASPVSSMRLASATLRKISGRALLSTMKYLVFPDIVPFPPLLVSNAWSFVRLLKAIVTQPPPRRKKEILQKSTKIPL